MDDITFNRFENFVTEVTDFMEEFRKIKANDACLGWERILTPFDASIRSDL